VLDLRHVGLGPPAERLPWPWTAAPARAPPPHDPVERLIGDIDPGDRERLERLVTGIITAPRPVPSIRA